PALGAVPAQRQERLDQLALLVDAPGLDADDEHDGAIVAVAVGVDEHGGVRLAEPLGVQDLGRRLADDDVAEALGRDRPEVEDQLGAGFLLGCVGSFHVRLAPGQPAVAHADVVGAAAQAGEVPDVPVYTAAGGVALVALPAGGLVAIDRPALGLVGVERALEGAVMHSDVEAASENIFDGKLVVQGLEINGHATSPVSESVAMPGLFV